MSFCYWKKQHAKRNPTNVISSGFKVLICLQGEIIVLVPVKLFYISTEFPSTENPQRIPRQNIPQQELGVLFSFRCQ